MSITLNEKQRILIKEGLLEYEKYAYALSETHYSLNRNLKIITNIKCKLDKNDNNFNEEDIFYITEATKAILFEFGKNQFLTALRVKMSPSEFKETILDLNEIFDILN